MGKKGSLRLFARLLCVLLPLMALGMFSAQAEQVAEKPAKQKTSDEKNNEKDADSAKPALSLLPLESTETAERESAELEAGVTATGKIAVPSTVKSGPRSAEQISIDGRGSGGLITTGSSALSNSNSPATPQQAGGSIDGSVVEVVVGTQPARPHSGIISTQPSSGAARTASGAPLAAKPQHTQATRPPAIKGPHPGAPNWSPGSPQKASATKSVAAKPGAAKPQLKPSKPAPKPVAAGIDHEARIRDYFAKSEERSTATGDEEQQESADAAAVGAVSDEREADSTVPTAAAVEDVKGTSSTTGAGGPLSIVMYLLAGAALILIGAQLSNWRGSKVSTGKANHEGKAMRVVDTVALGPGRQLTVVEVGGEALVLGVTAQNVVVLEKYSISRLHAGTSATDEARQAWRASAEQDDSNDWQRLRQMGSARENGSSGYADRVNARTISIEDLRRNRPS